MSPTAKRLLTVVLEVDDPVSASLVWEAHRGATLLAGCKVLTISDGDLLKHVERAVDEAVGYALEKSADREDHRR